MNEGRHQRWKWAGRSAGGVLSLALATGAVAAPPSGRAPAMPGDFHPADSFRGRLTDLVMRPSDTPVAPKLDLRVPSDLESHQSYATPPDAPNFSALRRADDEPMKSDLARAPDLTRADLARARLDPWPALAADGPAIRPMSRVEQLATRFRREGLPIARLFESRSALVSLGLNQRGKPGLWLIQKIP